MAKFERTVIGDFNQILKELDQAIMENAMSMNLVDESLFRSGEVQVAVRVYDKYFMRNNSRASLSLTVVDEGSKIYVTAIGAGGGQGVIFNYSWGAESELVDIVSECLDGMGLEAEY